MERGIDTLDMRRTVKAVMRDTDKRISVRETAAKNGISEEFAEQICRLYLTHPGVRDCRKIGNPVFCTPFYFGLSQRN